MAVFGVCILAACQATERAVAVSLDDGKIYAELSAADGRNEVARAATVVQVSDLEAVRHGGASGSNRHLSCVACAACDLVVRVLLLVAG